MKKKSLGANYLLNLSYQILIIILPIITTPYISRVLSADGVGAYNYVYAFAHVCTIIAALGTNKYATREIAYHQDNRGYNSKLFAEFFVLRLICVVIVLIVYSIGIVNVLEHKVIYLIMTLDIITVLFDISWFFQGLEEYKITVARNFAIKIVSILLMFIFVKDNTDVWKYALIMSGSMLIGQLTMWPYLPRYIDKISLKVINPFKHLMPSLVFFIPTISIQVYTNLDKVLIGMISTETEVGYFSQAEKIVKLVLTIISSFGIVLMPRIAILLKNKEVDKVNKNIQYSLNFVGFLSIPMTVGIILVASRFIPWFLGTGFDSCVTLLKILSPLIIIMGIASTTGASILIPLGRQKLFNISIICGMLMNLGLNLVLIPRYASAGAAVATLFAESTVTGMELYFLRDYVSLSRTFKTSWNYVIATGLMAIPVLLLNRYIPSGFLGIMIIAMLGCIVYIFVLFMLKDQFLFLIARKIVKKKGSNDEK